MKKLAILLTTALTALSLAHCGEKDGAGKKPAVIVVTFAVGGVTKSAAGSEGPLKVGDLLKKGDVITTGSKGRADLQFNENTVLTLAQNSELVISKLLAAYEKGSLQAGVDLKLGSLYAKVNKMQKGSDFRVNTPSVVAAVRGTEFYAEAKEDGSSEVAVSEGKVAVSSDDSEEMVIEEGNKVEVDSEGNVEEKETTEEEQKGFSDYAADIKTLGKDEWDKLKEGFQKDPAKILEMKSLDDLRNSFGGGNGDDSAENRGASLKDSAGKSVDNIKKKVTEKPAEIKKQAEQKIEEKKKEAQQKVEEQKEKLNEGKKKLEDSVNNMF